MLHLSGFGCKRAYTKAICTQKHSYHRALTMLLHSRSFVARCPSSVFCNDLLVRPPARQLYKFRDHLAAAAASDAAAEGTTALEAASQPTGARDVSHTERGSLQSDDRKQKRRPATQSTTILQAAAAAVGGPLPEVLAATLPVTFPTLSAARRVIRKDLILVDGQLGSCKTNVEPGQQLQQLEPVKNHKGPRTVSLQVLYEDDELAVVHKPWGVKMYGGDGRRTITGALKAGALKLSQNPDALPEPKPLHRLDAAVGGVLLVAKTAKAAADLSKQFVERRVHKVYHALLCGQLLPGSDSAAALQPQQQPELQQQDGVVSSDSTPAESTDGEGSEGEGGNDSQEESDLAQLLPLEELLLRQLQGSPAFTTSIEQLADPVLQPPEATTHTSTSTSSSSDMQISRESSTSTSTNTSDSDAQNGSGSSGSGSADGILQLGAGVHVIDLPVIGKPSYSLYQVLGFSRSSRYGGWVTSVALSPVTGRKHQLRRHMAALGCPIVGDGKYAINKEEHISNQGIYLESLELAFTHPTTQQRVTVRMDEPQRFATMRQQLHNRWRKLSQAGGTAPSEGSSEAAVQQEACCNESAADR